MKRDISIHTEVGPGGEIGEVFQKDGHTYVNVIKQTMHTIRIINEFEDMPGALVNTIKLDEEELRALIVSNIRDRKIFYRALDELDETERTEILLNYYKR